MSIALVVSMIGGDDKPDITTDLPDEQLPDSNPDEGGVDDGSGDEGTGDDDQSSDDGEDEDTGDDEGDDDKSGDDDEGQQGPPHRTRQASQNGKTLMEGAPTDVCSQQQDLVQRDAVCEGDPSEDMGSDANGPADDDVADADDEGQGEGQHQDDQESVSQANGNTNQNSQ